jgi:hypothetical protein
LFIALERLRPSNLWACTLLRTIEDAYGLPALGQAAAASPLSKI